MRIQQWNMASNMILPYCTCSTHKYISISGHCLNKSSHGVKYLWKYNANADKSWPEIFGQKLTGKLSLNCKNNKTEDRLLQSKRPREKLPRKGLWERLPRKGTQKRLPKMAPQKGSPERLHKKAPLKRVLRRLFRLGRPGRPGRLERLMLSCYLKMNTL